MRRRTGRGRALWLCGLLAACAHTTPAAQAPRRASVDPGAAEDAALEAVRTIHGGAGPWAVAGYRMGRYALEQLRLPRASRDLEIAHYSPLEVQYTCTADGAAAATGASLGRLNLSLHEAPLADLRTLYRNRKTGETIALRVTPGFVARFRDVPRERLGDAGREVLRLPDDQIFERFTP
jgi:formylmethanofuran dehydrogenase subunit E